METEYTCTICGSNNSGCTETECLPEANNNNITT